MATKGKRHDQQRPGESADQFTERQALAERMSQIRHKILVISGKGGVGKSTVAVNLAVALAQSGKQVGLLDVDIHGPSVPKLLGLEGAALFQGTGETIAPVRYGDNLKVMSIGFLLRGSDDAVIWRGPMKHGVIKQFLKDVEWGDLDYLIVDVPPGTGDEPLSVIQLIEDADGAVVVTTPQEVALIDVRKAVDFCRKLSLPISGVIENMSGFVCPKCGEVTNVFGSGGGETMAKNLGVSFLGRVPIDPQIAEAGDAGKPYVYHYAKSETAKVFAQIVMCLPDEGDPAHDGSDLQKGDGKMRIAIPLAAGKVSLHFGHCQEFELVDVNLETKEITNRVTLSAPGHEPGLLPRWLHEQGANVIIAGGMGRRAQQLFAQNDITVIVGTSAELPEQLVSAYLDGTLETGDNICDH